jgi:signal transduction histidine kinase
MEKIRNSRIRLIFIVSAALLLLLSVFSYIRITSLTTTSELVNHTTLVKLELGNVYMSVSEAEADQRGFVLTKDSTFIRRMDRNLFILGGQLIRLNELTLDNYSQQQNLAVLKDIITKRVDYMKAILVDSRKGKISKERWLGGRQITSDLQQQTAKMVTEEDMLLKLRNKSLTQETTLTPLFSIFLTFCGLIILIASYFMVFRELNISNNLKNELQESQQHLLQSNTSLLEKNASLATMNKELESFTYISSHDLQEPLRKIQTFVSRIIEKDQESLSDTGKSYLLRTQEAALRMQNLIQDLLAYSRLKKEIFPIEAVRLKDIVDEVSDDLSEEILENKAIIEVQGEAEIKIIPSQFRQLLINLISNAIKFTADGIQPHIIIDHSKVDGTEIPAGNGFPGSTFSKVTVTDNGIGFDPQYKKRIFEVFQRLHTKEEYSGTGIGLAIVEKIAENHKGFIFADSAEGEGAQFTFYLPA